MSTLRITNKDIHLKFKLECIKKGITIHKGVERVLDMAVKLDLLSLTKDELDTIIKNRNIRGGYVADFMALRKAKKS